MPGRPAGSSSYEWESRTAGPGGAPCAFRILAPADLTNLTRSLTRLRRLRRWCVPLIARHYLRLLRIRHVGRGHDLHRVFIEHIEDVPVQVSVEQFHRIRRVAVHVDLVIDAEIPELRLKNERRRVPARSRSPSRG